MSNPLADVVEGALRAIIGAPGEIEAGQAERLRAQLAELDRVLSAIGPNAPAIRAAVERRLAEIEAANATVDTMLVEGQRGLADRREIERKDGAP